MPVAILDTMGTWLHDVRYALRILIKSPGFTIVSVLTLALGIGANTAIFSIVNTVLLRSLPYRDPDHLVKIVMSNRGIGTRDIGFSVPELDDLRLRADVFDDVTVIWPADVNLTGSEHPERLQLLVVSSNYFSMLGANPQVGRVFGSQDQTDGFAEAVVISDGLWRRSFGKDPNILGRRLQLDSDSYTIIGVLEPGFRHPGRTVSSEVDVWVTTGFRADPLPKPARNLRLLPGALGRLRSGLTIQQAQARLNALANTLRREYPDDYPAQAQWSIDLESLQESLVGSVRPMLLVLMGSVILIVLISSVNIANLLLVRASGRQREMAIRQALGASRVRMLRQILTESIMLAIIAGVTGILTATVALHFVLRFVPSRIPRLQEVGIDWIVLAFTLLISILTGVIFGLAPAFQSAKADLVSAIREGTLGSGYSRKTNRLRSLLIISELALAVTLMVGAGLLLRTFWGLLQQNPGFNPARLVAASIWLPAPNNPQLDPYRKPGAQSVFVHELLRRVGTLPGIEAGGLTTDLPITGSAARLNLSVEDHPVESTQDQTCELSYVSPDYFKVMQASLVTGRFFSDHDDTTNSLVAIIDGATSRRYWPGQNPWGKRIRFGRDVAAPWFTIVGVISDMKAHGLDAKKTVPQIYVPVYQAPTVKSFTMVLRTSLAAATLESQIKRKVQSINPNLPVFNVSTMNDVISESLSPHRFSAELVGAFAALALLLASIGIYGLLSYTVKQRFQEIGVRIALGARPADISKMVLREGALLTGIGVFVGLLCAGIAAPLISSLLYGVHPIDPLVFIAVPVMLVTVALLASYIPATRASKVDPLVALRK